MSFITTLFLSLKIVLISTGAVSIAMGIKFSVPSILAFACYDLPVVWNSLLTFLKPPYLYFIINGIIITIAASSRFNHHHPSSREEPRLISVKTPPPSDVVAAVVLARREAELSANVVDAPLPLPPPPPLVVEEVYAAEDDDESEEAKVVELIQLKAVVVNGIHFGNDDVDDVANDDWMVSEHSSTPPQVMVSPETELDFLVEEKPLLSTRFGHRKPVKTTSPEDGRALTRVASAKEEETLESTWKMITEGRHVPLTRQLKKSDTWENHGRQMVVNPVDQEFPPRHVPKSETFRDRTNYDVQNVAPIPGKIEREASPSQDELNRRVEDFIKKFNEDMRLQRQESLNKFMEMINRGA